MVRVGLVFLVLGFVILAQAQTAGAGSGEDDQEIWKAHTKLIAAEHTTDEQMGPVAFHLMNRGNHSDETMAAAADARQRLESARHDFLDAYDNLNPDVKAEFIKKLNQRPDSEILAYDIFPMQEIADQIPRIGEIRAEQTMRMADRSAIQKTLAKNLVQQLDNGQKPFGSNQFMPSAQPANSIPLGVVSIDAGATLEINGATFDNNAYALTFDDGPLPRTSRPIMATLKQWGIKANYFQCGNMIAALSGADANLQAEQIQAGHLIANHSWDHPQMDKLSLVAAKKEIQDTFAIIERNLSGFNYRLPLFRFPYGARTPQLKAMLHDMGVTSVMWSIDTLDWKYPDPATILSITQPQIQKQGKGIILMHEIHPQSTIALPKIIQVLANRGAKVVQIQTAK